MGISEGQILEGKYAIIRRMGGGGMGIVYEAEHIALKLKVAVKVLHPSVTDDPNVIARFTTEARSAAGIRHPNVVEVTDFGLTPDGRPFFVMEYLEGESLGARLDKRGTLSEREAVEIADGILSGLAAAHEKGIVHRDLKPENILLARKEQGGETVKLLDFGIAKIVAPSLSARISTSESSRPQTLNGIVLGTPGYMAPETVTVDGAADARSDLFAVGVLLYEMLVGSRPFLGDSVRDTLMATAAAAVPQPSAMRPGISTFMERLILTALAKAPTDRFQTAEEFLRHLSAAAVGRLPESPRPCVTRVTLPGFGPEEGYIRGGETASFEELASLRRSSLTAPGSTSMRRSPLPAANPNAGKRPSLSTSRPSGPRRTPLTSSQPGGPPSASMPPPLRASTPSSQPPLRIMPKRRFSLPFSPWAVLMILALGAAVYFLFLREGACHRVSDGKTAAAPDR